MNIKEDQSKKRTIEDNINSNSVVKVAEVQQQLNRSEGSGYAGGGSVPSTCCPPPPTHRTVTFSQKGLHSSQLRMEVDVDHITPSPIIGKPQRERNRSRDTHSIKDKQDTRNR